MRKQIKIELIGILLASLITAVILSLKWQFPLGLMLASTLLINLGLSICMWYSEGCNRPILFQSMWIFYMGITAYCMISVQDNEFLGVGYDGYMGAQISLLLLIGCIVVTVIGLQSLLKVGKRRIDLWLPPLWPVVLMGVLSYIAHHQQIDNKTLRIGIICLMLSLISVTAIKNNHLQNQAISYHIATQHYLFYLFAFAVCVWGINQWIPKVTQLPGTHLLKVVTHNWGKGIVGDIEAETKLNRNPTQSEEQILEIESEGALYLRQLAYSTYERGKWKISAGDKVLTPLTRTQLIQPYELFQWVLDQMAAGNIKDQKLLNKYQEALILPQYRPQSEIAYIREIKPFTQYLTVNGVDRIMALEEETIGYYEDVDNLYFSKERKKDDITYSLSYKRYKPFPGTREAEVLKKLTAEDFEKLLAETTQYEEIKDQKLIMLLEENKNYDTLLQKYTQLPEAISRQLKGYGEKLTEGLEGNLEKAEAICRQLKSSGLYKYEINAPYSHKEQDPVVDFLLYGGAGICQDFASGMTLLCRSIGLPARYVTGYYSIERSEGSGMKYNVREKDAHAFVEVYLAGYGWMSFDPTPYATEEILVEERSIKPITPKIDLEFQLGEYTINLLFLIANVLFLWWLAPLEWMKNKVWKIYTVKQPPQQAIKQIMGQTLKCLKNKNIERKEAETLSHFAERLKEKGIDISPITGVFEKSYYGDQLPSNESIRQAMACYQKLRKQKDIPSHKKKDI